MKTNPYTYIGKRVKQTRKAKRYTQAEVAEMISMSAKNLSQLERGVTGISLSTLISLCNALDISADYILFGIENDGQSNAVNTMLSELKEKDTILFEIGKRIQKYRTQQNLTQAQVADTAGISQKHLSRIETGYHNPRFDMIIQIANALNVPIDALAHDLEDNDMRVFLESIRPTLEKMSSKQIEYVKKTIELLSGYEF